MADIQWRIIGDSVKGALHHRNGKPNQDAWAQSKTVHCVAVADGHGSAKHQRSDIGAQLAVEVTVELLEEFANQPYDVRLIKEASSYLPGKIVQAWREAVIGDHQKLELSGDPAQHIGEASATIEQNDATVYSLYGTTLLAALVTEDYALYLQIGDGNVLVLNDMGEIETPLPQNASFIANETNSLSQTKAANYFEQKIVFFAYQSPPVLISLCSDGYINSYTSPIEFETVIKDIKQLLFEQGAEKVQAMLPDWLNETSQQGSGDDITIALL
ncbi:MAG: protein phosphatase 2C domain-containing protein, partial [Methylomicrobium sp.]|nr:protein phosphatase 2C domain-containing protein [Methylomicrobium sp.]